jgi:hypothetical protein
MMNQKATLMNCIHIMHVETGDMLSEIRGASNTGEFQQLESMIRRTRTTRTRRIR